MKTKRHLTVAIYAANLEALRKLVSSLPLDYGCRPHYQIDSNGEVRTTAIVSEIELEMLLKRGLKVRNLFDQLEPDRLAKATIGAGDRFKGGKKFPRGPGSQPDASDDALGSILNVGEIGPAIQGLVNEYGLPTFDVPNQTTGGVGGKGGMVGPVNPDHYHVYFTAGVHARERGGPDNLIYFIADLLYARKHNTGLTYGTKSYSHADVIKALNTGIVFFPLVNPDGVKYDQQTNSLWRKNRNPANAIPGNDNSIGVDINRNYDFLWDFRRFFDPSIVNGISLASDKPQDETYHGPHAFSEAETKNVAWVIDKFPRLSWYMDIHSAAGDFLYNWGDDNDQLTDSSMNFLNPAYDGKRGVANDSVYREWILEQDFGKIVVASRRVTDAMQAVAGRSYKPMQAMNLYATSGASDDYTYSRHRVNAQHNKVHGFTMEFGYPTNFYPTLAEYHNNLKDTGAGLLEFCLAAADAGL